MACRPLHSTPVKKFESQRFSENGRVASNSGSGSSGIMSMGELETSTVEKQRKELQLLIGELKDRDRELNDMVAAHQQQLAAWERDRQRVLVMERKNERYEGELNKRTEQIRLLIQRLKVSESKHKSKDTALESTKVRMKQLEKDMSLTGYQVRDLKDNNVSLSTSVTDLSSKVGAMESREMELTSLLRIRENELRESRNHAAELSAKLRELDADLQDYKRSESRSRAEMQDERLKCKEAREELDQLKADMLEKTKQAICYRRDLSDLKEEVQRLRNETYMRDDEIRRKDDLIDLQRSKQNRAEKELNGLRVIYERQQQELSTLCARLSDSQELLEKQEERLNLIGDHSLQKESSNSSLKAVASVKSAVVESGDIPSFSAGVRMKPTDSNRDTERNTPESFQTLQQMVVQIGRSRIVKPGSLCSTNLPSKQSVENVRSVTYDIPVAAKTKDSKLVACNSEADLLESKAGAKRQKCQNGLDLSDFEDCGSDATNELLEEAWRSATSSAIILSDGDDAESHGHNFSQPSPTSKLQKLLAESREMVHNLERTAFTPVPRPSSAQAANGRTPY